VIISEVTPTSIVTAVFDTPTPAGQTPQATRTPRALVTSTPAPTATPEVQEYVVQSGDTLLGIAELFAPAGVEPLDFAQQIADINGFAALSDPIVTGQVLTIP
ncbi:MAG: LysM peptidoglycan-binding domain-containing protein, partial [Chloroflexi bacterium]|nr:LysM peptidoglycan-binding domain-containing protein [Chloroflexota bacterium]